MKNPLDILYHSRDGTLYPELQISNDANADTMPLGKYGQMCLKFLKDEHPDRYAELRMNGELMPLMERAGRTSTSKQNRHENQRRGF